jgi:hypothetical protein
MPRRWLATDREKANAATRASAGSRAFRACRVVIQKGRLDRDNYTAVPVMSDGREGPPLELRSLFEQFHTEAR